MEKIYTERFVLREITKKDNEEIFKLLSDEDIVENLNMNIHKTINDTNDLINDYLEEYKKGNKFPHAIIDSKTNEFIGVFLNKLDLYDEDCFEFTVYIKKDRWGQGIYTEILPYMIKEAFEDIKTGNYRGFVMEKNIASSIVLKKCGFKLEKIFEVPGLPGKIQSYLITKKDYFETMKKIMK